MFLSCSFFQESQVNIIFMEAKGPVDGGHRKMHSLPKVLIISCETKKGKSTKLAHGDIASILSPNHSNLITQISSLKCLSHLISQGAVRIHTLNI